MTPEELIARWRDEARAHNCTDAFEGWTAGDVAEAYTRCAQQLEAVLIEQAHARFVALHREYQK